MSDDRWTSVEPSEFSHERAALDFIRRRLPDSDPWRAWSNFTFIDSNGRPAEVDLLVVAPSGVHLIEIKSYPEGVMKADAGTWVWERKRGAPRRYDNPLRLAESKAKRLKSLLSYQQAFRHGGPKNAKRLWVSASIFLSSPDLRVELDDRLEGSVFGPDPDGDQICNLDGIIEHLKTLDPRYGAQVNRPLAGAIDKAMEQADIRQSEKYRRAGSLRLVEQVEQDEDWVDFRAVHQLSKVNRRVRLHVVDLTADDEGKQRRLNAIEREFRLLGGLQHPGIESPLQMEPNPRGLALVYPWDDEATRLDHWVADAGDLDVLDRLELFRSIAEAVAYAHEHGLSHRALSPRAVWVSETEGEPVPRLRDWTAAARDGGTADSTRVDGTVHAASIAQLITKASGAYAAPELRTIDNASGRLADVFALGCLLHLLISGKDPADDADELQVLLDEHGHVPLAAAMDQAPAALAEVVQLATQADANERIESVPELLSWLDAALAELTAPEEVDLLTASKGTELEGWTILGRIGAGATSVVLLAEREDGTQEVLKVARDLDNAERLRKEHRALSSVSHPAVIRTFGIEDVAGHTVLRLEPGKIRQADGRLRAETLAARLEAEGPPTIDFLERWGLDLLDALVALEREGVDHRDIKPENLVLVERTKNKELHLALIDFSLADASHDDVDAGTLGYLDPFLRDREQRRWDLHAERYAAAVVLTQLVTGERPTWGEGVDPRATDRETPQLRTEGIDAAIAGRVVPLLERALHREPEQRFDTAEQLRNAWRRVFTEVDSTTGHTLLETAAAVDELDLSAVTASTPLVELGLPPRLVGAIERLGVGDAGALAAVPGNRLSSIAGVGAQVRRELRRLVTRLRDAGLGDDAVSEDLDDLSPAELDRVSVDRLAARLVPQRSGLPAEEKTALLVYLGLERHEGTDEVWPTRNKTVEATGFDADEFVDVLLRARRRWANGRPELTIVRTEIVEWLATREGVATGSEAVDLLLARRGSVAGDDVIRRRRAGAVIRAVTEAESTLEEPRLRAVRVAGQLFLALDTTWEVEGRGQIEFRADPLVEAAVAFGEVADGLVADEEVVAPDAVARALEEVELPQLPNGVAFSPARRLALAAASSETAAASSRRELYRRDLDTRTALRASRLALLDRHGLSPEQLRDRVRARFPQAESLPTAPALTTLVQKADIGLRWEAELGRYVIETTGSPLESDLTSVFRTRFTTPMSELELQVDELDRVLDRLTREGGFCAASVDPRELSTAAKDVAARLDATVVDLDARLVAHMRAAAEEANAEWPVLLDADADDATGRRWKALNQLVDRAVPRLVVEVRDASRAVVGHQLGLLARYGHLDAFDVVRDELTHTTEEPGGLLRALVLIVPDSGGGPPSVDGVPVPVVTSAQTARIPRTWLHRGAAA